jgi:glycosyltransferase involved in cell wall biosynthesis
MREKLTVLIPCKNERKNIRRCIQSVQDIADEILVADSGSTDGTLDIVRRIDGCRVIEREYVNSADFKNWAIPQAKFQWVLVVDADERITQCLADEIEQLLLDPPEHLDAYRISFDDFFMGHLLKYSRWDTDSTRLFCRDVCHYQQRRVHADIDIDHNRVGKLKGKILHYSFWSYEEYLHKYMRYTMWAAKDRYDRGKRTGFYGLLIRPMLRFLHLYVFRGGFLDGLPGIQICMLTAFHNTFLKQAKLWEMEHVTPERCVESQEECVPSSVLRYPAPKGNGKAA